MNNALSQRPVASVDNNITYQVMAVTSEGCTATDVVNAKVYKGADINERYKNLTWTTG